MSDYQSYQHIPSTAARDAHETHALRQGERTSVKDHSAENRQATYQTAPATDRPKVDWANGEKLSYQVQRDYNEQGAPIIEGRVADNRGMRVTTREHQDPMTGKVTKTASVTAPFGDKIDAGEQAEGAPISLASIDTARLADKIASEGGLAIRDLSAVQSAGVPEDFASEVADVIAGRETRTPSEVPAQFSPFVDEFHASGSLSEKSLTKLERMGVSRQLVHRMIRGRAKIEANTNARVIHHPNAINQTLEHAAARQRGL